MDGHFVPNLTYGMPIVASLRDLTELTLDVHLMIANPLDYAAAFRDAGADIITVHVEAVSEPVTAVREIQSLGVGAGLAINPHTPFEKITAAAAACDIALVMSVPAGFGGQPFDSCALQRLADLRRDHPDLVLEVDGGVNIDTIGRCTDAGADLLVVGSAIFRHASYSSAIDDLSAAAKKSSSAS
jgi:ribulose-phosphate 3-epimerase